MAHEMIFHKWYLVDNIAIIVRQKFYDPRNVWHYEFFLHIFIP